MRLQPKSKGIRPVLLIFGETAAALLARPLPVQAQQRRMYCVVFDLIAGRKVFLPRISLQICNLRKQDKTANTPCYSRKFRRLAS